MKIRSGIELLEQMRQASVRHKVTYSEIARKALRKTRRQKIITGIGRQHLRRRSDPDRRRGKRVSGRHACRNPQRDPHGYLVAAARRLRRRAPSMTAGS